MVHNISDFDVFHSALLCTLSNRPQNFFFARTIQFSGFPICRQQMSAFYPFRGGGCPQRTLSAFLPFFYSGASLNILCLCFQNTIKVRLVQSECNCRYDAHLFDGAKYFTSSISCNMISIFQMFIFDQCRRNTKE